MVKKVFDQTMPYNYDELVNQNHKNPDFIVSNSIITDKVYFI